MIFKVILLLVIAWLVLRTVRNLVRAILADSPARPPIERPNTWQGPVARPKSRRDDVEDARWKDV